VLAAEGLASSLTFPNRSDMVDLFAPRSTRRRSFQEALELNPQPQV